MGRPGRPTAETIQGSQTGLCDMSESAYCEQEHLSLCEALDRVLHKGAVIMGEVTISVAEVDLIYLGLQLIVCSLDTAMRPAPEAKISLGAKL